MPVQSLDEELETAWISIVSDREGDLANEGHGKPSVRDEQVSVASLLPENPPHGPSNCMAQSGVHVPFFATAAEAQDLGEVLRTAHRTEEADRGPTCTFVKPLDFTPCPEEPLHAGPLQSPHGLEHDVLLVDAQDLNRVLVVARHPAPTEYLEQERKVLLTSEENPLGEHIVRRRLLVAQETQCVDDRTLTRRPDARGTGILFPKSSIQKERQQE